MKIKPRTNCKPKRSDLSVISPCVECVMGLGCCGCSDERNWRAWKESLTTEEWNDKVLEEGKREADKIIEKYSKLLIS